MEQVITRKGAVRRQDWAVRSQELSTELFRKTIHMMISLVPIMAFWNRTLTMIVLLSGTLGYTIFELLRQQGRSLALVSSITVTASRERDQGRFVLGPVMLALGALVSVALFPPKAASVAIFALAFGDGLASLAGKFLGRIRIPFSGGKTLAGSLTCFGAVYISSALVLHNPLAALPIALTATLIELLPLKDFDNIFIPLGVGALTLLFL